MLLIATDYDAATQDNMTLVNEIVQKMPQIDPVLTIKTKLSADAEYQSCLADMQQENLLCIFSHGEEHAIKSQTKKHLLDTTNINTLAQGAKNSADVQQKIIYVYACWTANALGRAACQHDMCWFGYTGAIQAPSSEPKAVEICAELLCRLLVMLAGYLCQTTLQIQQEIQQVSGKFWQLLDALCEYAEQRVDEACQAGSLDDISTVFYFLEHFRRRLCVWLPSQTDTPYQHPTVKSGLIPW